MDNDETTIRSRIAGREMAALLFDLIRDRLKDTAFMEACCNELRKIAGLDPPPPEPEKHEPIARLGQMQMVFGAHKGKPFDDIPLEYLDWLCGTQEDFYRTLRAYLKHPQLQQHRGEYDDGGDD